MIHHFLYLKPYEHLYLHPCVNPTITRFIMITRLFMNIIQIIRKVHQKKLYQIDTVLLPFNLLHPDLIAWQRRWCITLAFFWGYGWIAKMHASYVLLTCCLVFTQREPRNHAYALFLARAGGIYGHATKKIQEQRPANKNQCRIFAFLFQVTVIMYK